MRKWLYAITGAAAAIFAPLAVLAVKECDVSAYDPNKNHGLLQAVQAKCAVCGECSIADIFTVGNTVTKLILGLSGSIMLLMVIYGGFLMLTSSGNAQQIEKAKKVLVGAIIGLVIVFVAYTAVEFILGALGVPNAGTVFGLPFATGKK